MRRLGFLLLVNPLRGQGPKHYDATRESLPGRDVLSTPRNAKSLPSHGGQWLLPSRRSQVGQCDGLISEPTTEGVLARVYIRGKGEDHLPPKDPAHENGAVLVGRHTQIECLSAVVQDLTDGRGTVLEVTGEPGIGKTALLALLAERAAGTGALVARAHAPRTTTQPGQVIRDVLDALDVGDSPIARGLGAGAGAEVRGVLGRWAARHGGVLVLDNVHLWDEESARLIAQLVRTPPPGPFVLALAHRPRQAGPVLREALEHGVETGSVTRLAPSHLDLPAISTLLGHRGSLTDATSRHDFSHSAPDHAYTDWRASPAPVLDGTYAEQLHAASGGNPRMLRILVAARWDPDVWPLSAGPDREGMLREAVSVVTELDSLTADAALSAQVAAVLGDPFLPDDVAAVSELGLERILGAFTELVEADLVRPLPWGGGYVFRNPVLGHVALEHASPSLRVNAHRRALDLLTTRGATALRRARQAEHLVGAGSAQARQVLVEGAAEAMAKSPAVAARWLRLALDHLPAGERISEPRVVLVLDHCRALSAVGRLQEARSLVHDLLRHQSDLSVDLRLSAYAVCGELERLLGRHQEAEAVVRTALGLVPRPLPVPLPAPAAELIGAYGRVQLFRGAYGEARDVVREAAEAAEAVGPAAPYLRALGALGDTQLGLLPEAVAEVTKCARIVDALPDAAAVTMPDVLAMLGCAELFQERFHDAYRHLERGLQATTGATRRFIRINQLVALCHLDQLTGRLESLCRRAGEAELLARTSGVDEAAGIAMILRATGLLWTRPRRDADRLLELAGEGLSLALRKRGWRAAVAVGLRAHAQFLGGDPAGCLRTLVEEEARNCNGCCGRGNPLSWHWPPSRHCVAVTSTPHATGPGRGGRGRGVGAAAATGVCAQSPSRAPRRRGTAPPGGRAVSRGRGGVPPRGSAGGTRLDPGDRCALGPRGPWHPEGAGVARHGGKGRAGLWRRADP